MKKFKSTVPDVTAFQWTPNIDLKEKLTELIGNSDFTLTKAKKNADHRI